MSAPIKNIDLTQNGVHCLTESAARVMQERGIRVVKQNESANIPDRRASALRRLAEIESELGRVTRLVVELRADVLNLTTE